MFPPELHDVPIFNYRFMDKEIWKDIPGYEGLYQVSNTGKVVSLKYYRTEIKKELQNIFSKGYLVVNLFLNKKQRAHKIHRLVAQAFITNSENKPQVNHINGIKTDNRLENLEWCTSSENNFHRYRVLGVKTSDKQRKKARINGVNSRREIVQYDSKGNIIKKYISQKQASICLGISEGYVSLCVNGKTKTAKGYILSYIL